MLSKRITTKNDQEEWKNIFLENKKKNVDFRLFVCLWFDLFLYITITSLTHRKEIYTMADAIHFAKFKSHVLKYASVLFTKSYYLT